MNPIVLAGVVITVALATFPAQAQSIPPLKLNEMIMARALGEGRGLAMSYAEIEAMKNCGAEKQNPIAGWEAYEEYMREQFAGVPGAFAQQRAETVASHFDIYHEKYSAIQKACAFYSEEQKKLSAMQTAKKIRYNTSNIAAILKKIQPLK